MKKVEIEEKKSVYCIDEETRDNTIDEMVGAVCDVTIAKLVLEGLYESADRLNLDRVDRERVKAAIKGLGEAHDIMRTTITMMF